MEKIVKPGVIFRKANNKDLPEIVRLLHDDPLGKTRENPHELSSYEKAFLEISIDPNQFLMVLEKQGKVIGTCHLTVIPSLTFQGSRRLHLEAVRIDAAYRDQGLGKLMIQEVKHLAEQKGCHVVELTTNKSRAQAKRFYESLGFEATHEGMKWSAKDVSTIGIS